MRPKKILITGASGHLGLGLLKAAIEGIHFSEIICTAGTEQSLDNLTGLIKKIDCRDKVIKPVLMDLKGSLLNLEDALNGSCDAVIHSAARVASEEKPYLNEEGFNGVFDRDLYSTNIVGTARFYEIISKITIKQNTKLIFVSSGDVYGRMGRIDEGCLPAPRTVYGLTKYMGEILSRNLAEKHNVDLSIVRVGSIYGPGQRVSKGVKHILSNLFENNKVNIWGEGKQLRNSPYVMDVANCAHLLLEKMEEVEDTPEILNCGSSSEYSVAELCEAACDSYKRHMSDLGIDKSIELIKIKSPDPFENYILDSTKAYKFTRMQETPLKEGVRRQLSSIVNGGDIFAVYEAL